MKHENGLFNITGRCTIYDESGNIIFNKNNAIHPQNMARVIGRALAGESNFWIHRIAFGNGGTLIDAANNVTFKTPNTGQPPDVATWDSRLYNETYSEIINEGGNFGVETAIVNPLLGTDPGTAGPNIGTRLGGGASPTSDPTSIPHVSGPGVRSSETSSITRVRVSVTLNQNEPSGQFDTIAETPEDSSFVFDEIGLYTTGEVAIDSNGVQDVDINNKNSLDDTFLAPNTAYNFSIRVNGGVNQTIVFITPAGGGSGTGGEILYGDFCQAINTGDTNWNTAWSGRSPLPGGSTVSITDNSGLFSSITGSQTFGFLRFSSSTVGINSSVDLTDGINGTASSLLTDPRIQGMPMEPVFSTMNTVSTTPIQEASQGQEAGVQNSPTSPNRERERLLTHLIFEPITKPASKIYKIVYDIDVTVR
jgi:hypothetical protein